jgi:hypothetical protein
MDFQRIFGGFSTVWWFCNGYSAELSVTRQVKNIFKLLSTKLSFIESQILVNLGKFITDSLLGSLALGILYLLQVPETKILFS